MLVIFTHKVSTSQIHMSFHHWCLSTLCSQESESVESSLGTLMTSGRSSSISVSIGSGSGSMANYGISWYLVDAQLLSIGYSLLRLY